MYQYGLSFGPQLSYHIEHQELSKKSSYISAAPSSLYFNVPEDEPTLLKPTRKSLTVSDLAPTDGSLVVIKKDIPSKWKEGWYNTNREPKLFDAKLKKTELMEKKQRVVKDVNPRQPRKPTTWNDDTHAPGKGLFGEPPPLPPRVSEPPPKRKTLKPGRGGKARPGAARKPAPKKSTNPAQRGKPTNTRRPYSKTTTTTCETQTEISEFHMHAPKDFLIPQENDSKGKGMVLPEVDDSPKKTTNAVLNPSILKDQIENIVHEVLRVSHAASNAAETERHRNDKEVEEYDLMCKNILDKWRHLEYRQPPLEVSKSKEVDLSHCNRSIDLSSFLQSKVNQASAASVHTSTIKHDKWVDEIVRNRDKFQHHRDIVEAALHDTGLKQWQIVAGVADLIAENLVVDVAAEFVTACDALADEVFETG